MAALCCTQALAVSCSAQTRHRAGASSARLTVISMIFVKEHASRGFPLSRPHEAAVHRFAAALVSGGQLSDMEFAEIEQAIGRDGVAEVLVLIGYYTSVALGMKVHQVPIPPPAA